MRSDILISIIIPCYNDAKFIEQAIDSAINQTHTNKEIIVVDDGSNKDTKVVLKSLESKIDKLIAQENLGQSTARNNGIKQANGNYVLVLDSDDYFENSFCQKALDIFNNDSNIKLVTCYANLVFEKKTNNYIYKPKGGTVESFLTSNSALGSAMFKKNDWNSCGGYDETMRNGLEDWEFYIRLLSRGGKAEVIKEPLYNYRKRENTTTAKANKAKYDLLKFIFAKHKDLNIRYYDSFMKQLVSKIEKEEKEKFKNRERIEFKIGELVLKPFRWIKAIFR
ncbi:glycosyltransferase [Pontimicrobium aquaticum]|uniref:Glycosyltransferase n=1 Tax=Pontimicrobium aquaticum TaxID=2565367 RepID=A0A4U0EMT3_9FLAO|nr:glycosyltransferase [Pontimicrobium aquaticum]TJY32896.1 glycosyltransferase [Pontimicrobium aquaticum]